MLRLMRNGPTSGGTMMTIGVEMPIRREANRVKPVKDRWQEEVLTVAVVF